MIIGVGLDLVDLTHFRRVVQKGGARFYEKCLTDVEYKEWQGLSTTQKLKFGAKRYAVKEAFAKACGTGLGDFVGLKDVGLSHDKSGAPKIVLSRSLSTKIVKKFGKNIQINVSVSDDGIAGAIVILSQN